MRTSLHPKYRGTHIRIAVLVLLALLPTVQLMDLKHKNKVGRVVGQDCGRHMTCMACTTSADRHCGWCSVSKRCTGPDSCDHIVSQGIRTGWIGACPGDTPINVYGHDYQILIIVIIIAVIVMFNLTLGASVIVFIPFIVVIYLCRRRHRQQNQSEEELIEFKDLPTRIEQSTGENAETTSSPVQMDEATLRSLLVAITRDDELQEAVKSVFIQRMFLKLNDNAAIGTGNFGRVYFGLLQLQEGLSEGYTEKVAVKTLYETPSRAVDRETMESLLREGIMMKDLRHENVLHLLGVSFSEDDRIPLIILPYMAKGDLKQYVRNKKKRFTWQQLGLLGQQVAKGMAYLAECKIVHRDLAARNCMIDINLKVKVADFGLSRDLYEEDYYVIQTCSRPMPVKWMALESLKEKFFTTETDVWSFGVLLWELMTYCAEIPYPHVETWDAMSEHLTSGHRLSQPDICPDNIYRLMRECWQTNPADRPTFADIVNRLELLLNKSTYMNFRFSRSFSLGFRRSRMIQNKISPSLVEEDHV